MGTISAREANQKFSALLKRVQAGETVVITKRGEPVATLAPTAAVRSEPAATLEPITKDNQLQPCSLPVADPEERAKAHAEMIEFLREGVSLGGRKFTRDEMHER